MSARKVDTVAAGPVHHIFADKVCHQDNYHPAHYYDSKVANIQIILNDHQTHVEIFAGHDYEAAIVSLLEQHMNLATGSKHLVGVLANNCSCTTPVVLSFNVSLEMIVLEPEDSRMSIQPPIPVSEKVDLPEGMKAYQVPLILLLYGDRDIVQGSMNNP